MYTVYSAGIVNRRFLLLFGLFYLILFIYFLFGHLFRSTSSVLFDEEWHRALGHLGCVPLAMTWWGDKAPKKDRGPRGMLEEITG